MTPFTSGSYHRTWYRKEQEKRQLSSVSYYEDGPQYFGMMPGFTKSSMKGDFPDTTMIMMGCDGLSSDTIAEAFVEKGANAVVAWDGLVSSSHTDAATQHLLHHLLIDGLTMQEAVTQTMAEVGPDPSYGSTPLLYPSEKPVAAAHRRPEHPGLRPNRLTSPENDIEGMVLILPGAVPPPPTRTVEAMGPTVSGPNPTQPPQPVASPTPSSRHILP